MSKITRIAGQKVKLAVGSYAMLDWTFKEPNLQAFSKVIRDKNPIPFSAEAAQKRGFQDRIVYGMMTGSIISNLLGNLFPGAVYASQDFQFKAPVYFDEALLVKIVVEHLEKTSKGNYKCCFDTSILKLDLNTKALYGKALVILDSNEVKISN